MSRRLSAVGATLLSLGLLAGAGAVQARVNCTHDGFEQVGDLLVPSPVCMNRNKPEPVAQTDKRSAPEPRSVRMGQSAARDAKSTRGAHPDAAWQNGPRQYHDGFVAVGDTTPVFVGLPQRERATQMAGDDAVQPGSTQTR